jgi:hypothetical protein
MRTIIAVILPLWAVAMIVMGVEGGSIWWILVGLVVGGVSLLMLAGGPLADLFMKDRLHVLITHPAHPEASRRSAPGWLRARAGPVRARC